ncbi:MAG: site-specific DNA-methyltransferase, partial [Oscillibacter sp.]|nr:site-specific DNA-methyltransferase [Oscillibacter sp.]
GDNLEVLKLLMTAYFRKVKMIYIDPPFNTGNDFVYTDDYADPLERYKEVTAQTTKSNPETMGRFHTNWLNMMYPRLRLAANLLRDDGVCFISIDDNEVTNLRKLCDEAFGEENFVAQLIWERAYAPKNDARYISNSHEYILMYAKSLPNFQIGRLARTEEANARYQNPDNDPRGVWKPSDMSVKTYNAECDYPITTPSGRVIEPPTGRCWRLSKKAFLERLHDNRIYFGADGNSVPCIKRFLTELKFEGMAPQSIMFYKDVGHSQEGAKEVTALLEAGAFNGPKPVRLLRRLLTLANTEQDSIIMDFFSGSATTAHAVMQLNAEDGGNRQFIMVQLPEVCDEKSEAYKAGFRTICEIGKERIRRAGAKILDEAERRNSQLKIGEAETPPPDVGFRVFKLDASNLKTWDSAPIEGDRDEQLEILHARMMEMIHRIKPDRNALDMVFEVMLKMGVPLSLPVTEVDINGKTAYSVGEDTLLLVSLAPSLTAEDIEVMADYAPAKVIISQESFDTNSDSANAYYILRDRGIDLKLL